MSISPLGSASCPICLDFLDKESVSHGEGNWHPMCKKCALVWFKIKSVCPVCQQHVDFSSLLPLKERISRGGRQIGLWILRKLQAPLPLL